MRFLILLLLFGCSGRSTTGRHISSITNLNERYGIPGIAGAIFQDSSFTEMKVSGIRKAGEDTALEVTDKFHLGSCTKAMTATLAHMLIEEGKLNWTSKLSDLLPGYTLHPHYAEMNFESLLVHRAGLPVEDSLFSEVRYMDSVQGRKLITERMLTRTPLTTPDQKYRYSNYSYIIAGHILETLTGDSWENLIRNYLFRPLDMNTCGFGVTSIEHELVPSEPWGHVRENGEVIPRHFDNPLTFGPASSVHCSLGDWGKFLSLHLRKFRENPDHKLYSVHPAKDSSYTYGGWNLLQRNWADGPTLSHTGSNTLNYAKVWIAPNKNSFIVSTANIGGEEAFLATDAFIQELISKHLH